MKFEIHAKRPGEDIEEIFFYDNMENKLSDKARSKYIDYFA